LSGHKLNIIDDIINIIILSVTLLVILLIKLSYHRIICLFESHYNTLHHFLSIYRGDLPVDIFIDVLYRRVNSIGNVVYKSYISSYSLTLFFFHSLFPIVIPSVYIDGIFLSMFTNRYRDEKLCR
jgi:hypothetical protein